MGRWGSTGLGWFGREERGAGRGGRLFRWRGGEGERGVEANDFLSERWRKVAKPWYTWNFAETTNITFRVSSSDVQETSD